MKRLLLLTCVTALTLPFLVLTANVANATPQSGGVWDAPALKKAVEDIGYETKELNKEVGKEKYEFLVKREDLDIPIACEISPSKNYIWLTVFLGEAPKADSPKSVELLKQNGQVQPCLFYITTSGKLMLALPIDNRGMTNAILRARVDKLAGDVVKTQPVWK